MPWTMNVDELEEREDFSTPIPEGFYQVLITSAEDSETQKGGRMVAMKTEVIEGEYKGRWLSTNFNWINDTPKTQRSAQSQLKEISKEYAGLSGQIEISEVVGTVIEVKVVVKHSDYYQRLVNEIAYVVKKDTKKHHAPKPIEEPIPEDDIPF